MLACGQVLLHTSIHKEKYLADEIFQNRAKLESSYSL